MEIKPILFNTEMVRAIMEGFPVPTGSEIWIDRRKRTSDCVLF